MNPAAYPPVVIKVTDESLPDHMRRRMSEWITEACAVGNLPVQTALRWVDLQLEHLVRGVPIRIGDRTLGANGIQLVVRAKEVASRVIEDTGANPQQRKTLSLHDEFVERAHSQKAAEAMKAVDLSQPDAVEKLLTLYQEEKKRLTGKVRGNEKNTETVYSSRFAGWN